MPEFRFRLIGNPPTQDPSPPHNFTKDFPSPKDCFCSLRAYSCSFSKSGLVVLTPQITGMENASLSSGRLRVTALAVLPPARCGL